MKVLHILKDGPSELSRRIADAHAGEHEVRVIDLSSREESYEQIIDDLFSYDRVLSW